MSILKEEVRNRTDLIKSVLGNRCFFCENNLGDLVSEVSFLPLCKNCYCKYDLNERLIEQKKWGGDGHLFNEHVKIVRDFFSNRCFFCEKQHHGMEENRKEEITTKFGKVYVVEILFALCDSSCWLKFRMLNFWAKRLASGDWV